LHKYFSLIFLLIFIISGIGIPQTSSNPVKDNSILLSRYRLSLGYVSLLSEDANFEFRHLFFNLSFRSSGFDKASSSFKIKLAFEPGINGLIIAEKDFYNELYFNLYFVPYAKFGPEVRLSKNIFLGGSFGLILASYESSFFPLPFAGLNSFYLIELNENLFIELESGFHTTFSPGKLPYLIYITAGLSLN